MVFIILLLVILIDSALSDDCTQDSSQYIQKIQTFLNEINISDSLNHQIYYEACNLESIGKDVYGREQFLSAKSAKSFNAMRRDAIAEGIKINIISAFRSFEYQESIIRRKIKKGNSISYILQENMIPGYSQHHTGCGTLARFHQ